MTPTLPHRALLIAANRGAVYGTVGRWLLHDLRGPAQTVGLVAELMPDALPDPALHATLGRAAGQLVRSMELLDRVLRVPSRTSELTPVRVADVLAFIAALQRTQKSNVLLEVEPALAAPLPAVAATEEHLEHALLNLVVNALEAQGERTAGRVRIGATARGGWVELTVEDDGPGISASVRARLFELFVTTKQGRSPAGLGLPVARWLLEEMGGSLECAASRGAGASFAVRLRAWVR